MSHVPDFVDAIPGNRHAFDRLERVLRSGNAIAWVGAGASAGLYPVWGQLVGRLIDETGRRGLASVEDQAFWRSLSATKPQQAVQLIEAKLTDPVFRAILRELFGRKVGSDGKGFTPAHAAIVGLAVPRCRHDELRPLPARSPPGASTRHARDGIWHMER
jgi:hypothetical protein